MEYYIEDYCWRLYLCLSTTQGPIKINSLPDYCLGKYHEIKRLPHLHVLLLRGCESLSCKQSPIISRISDKMAWTPFHLNKTYLRHLDEIQFFLVFHDCFLSLFGSNP